MHVSRYAFFNSKLTLLFCLFEQSPLEKKGLYSAKCMHLLQIYHKYLIQMSMIYKIHANKPFRTQVCKFFNSAMDAVSGTHISLIECDKMPGLAV